MFLSWIRKPNEHTQFTFSIFAKIHSVVDFHWVSDTNIKFLDLLTYEHPKNKNEILLYYYKLPFL